VSTPNTTGSDVVFANGPVICTWGDEAVTAVWNAQALCSTAAFSHVAVSFDGAANQFPGAQFIFNLSNFVPVSIGGPLILAEGAHQLFGAGGSAGQASGNLQMQNGNISGFVRG